MAQNVSQLTDVWVLDLLMLVAFLTSSQPVQIANPSAMMYDNNHWVAF